MRRIRFFRACDGLAISTIELPLLWRGRDVRGVRPEQISQSACHGECSVKSAYFQLLTLCAGRGFRRHLPAPGIAASRFRTPGPQPFLGPAALDERGKGGVCTGVRELVSWFQLTNSRTQFTNPPIHQFTIYSGDDTNTTSPRCC